MTKPWNVLTVNEKDTQKTYLVKSIFKEDGYHVMLSDTCSVWEETISSTKVNERLRVSNYKGTDVSECPLVVVFGYSPFRSVSLDTVGGSGS